MRVSAEARAFFDDAENAWKVRYFMSQFGGWERWFQMEFAWQMQKKFGRAYDIVLERKGDYENYLMRSDMHIYGRTLHRPETIVELKCETFQTANFTQLVQGDIEKRKGQKDAGADYQVVAVAINQLSLDDTYMKLKGQYHEAVSIIKDENWPIAGILFYYEGGPFL